MPFCPGIIFYELSIGFLFLVSERKIFQIEKFLKGKVSVFELVKKEDRMLNVFRALNYVKIF